jgi:hypothetical protein
VSEVAIRRSVRRLLVAACVVPSSPILVTLMKEAPGTTALTRATRRNTPEDTILHFQGYCVTYKINKSLANPHKENYMF